MNRPIRLFNAIVLGTAIILGTVFSSNAANVKPFQEIAAEILTALDGAKIEQLPARSGYGAPTISIKPFAEHDSAIDMETANGYNRHLLAALQHMANGRFEFVSRHSVAVLVETIQSSGLSEDETARRIADLNASSRTDVLITGDIRLVNGVAVLSYQALNTETARVFVSTQPRAVTEPITSVRSPVILPVGGFNRIVAEAESLLADMGYNPGRVDGQLTPETRSALSAYQSDSALPVNGRMTRQVVENMRRDTR